MRENRFTGKIEMLKKSGEVFSWRDVSTPIVPTRWYTEEEEKKALEVIQARGGYKDKGDTTVDYVRRKKELEEEILTQSGRLKKMLESVGLDSTGAAIPNWQPPPKGPSDKAGQ